MFRKIAGDVCRKNTFFLRPEASQIYDGTLVIDVRYFGYCLFYYQSLNAAQDQKMLSFLKSRSLNKNS
jgi:hypothetical protein